MAGLGLFRHKFQGKIKEYFIIFLENLMQCLIHLNGKFGGKHTSSFLGNVVFFIMQKTVANISTNSLNGFLLLAKHLTIKLNLPIAFISGGFIL